MSRRHWASAALAARQIGSAKGGATLRGDSEKCLPCANIGINTRVMKIQEHQKYTRTPSKRIPDNVAHEEKKWVNPSNIKKITP